MIFLTELKADAEGVFLERINKFLGIAELSYPHEGRHHVHIHDPGRLDDILEAGRRILLKRGRGERRKTKWDIIAGWNGYWILIHSGYHRIISEEILGNEKASPFGKADGIIAEKKYGESRLDFVVTKNGREIWVEVKGCTLEKGGKALFPDAPTERGRKHLETLVELRNKGYGASVIFLIFRREAKCFLPNRSVDTRFADAFYNAMDAGVDIHALRIIYEEGKIYFDGEIPVCGRR